MGVSGFGSASHNAALIRLQRFKLEPNKDVAIVVAGPTTDRWAAMAAGSIDATLLTATETVTARKRGYNEVYDMLDMGIEVQGNGFATARSYINNQRENARGALKCYVEAIHYIHHHKDASKKITTKYMRTSDPDVLEAGHAGFVKMVSKRPYPTLKRHPVSPGSVRAETAASENAKPEQFVDLTLLQELEKEGFFADLAKRYAR